MVDGPLDTVLGIETPEHLAFRVRIAGPARRFGAWLLDAIVRGIIAVVGTLILQQIGGATGLGGASQGVWFFLVFLLDWFYFVGCELALGGRSPGKMAFALRAMRVDGLPIGLRESVLRNLLRALDVLLVPPVPLPVGGLLMAFDPRFRRAGDWVAGTMVVVEDRSATIAQKKIVPPTNGLVPQPLALPRDDLEALELFARREQIGPARRAELAEIVAAAYAARLGVPTPNDPVAFLVELWAKSEERRA